MVREEVLAALEHARGTVISGEALSQKLHVSRAAIWKAIDRLRADGLQIDAVHGGGYCLVEHDDSLTVAAVQSGLHTQKLGRELVILPTTASTNTMVKREYHNQCHGFTLLSIEQTAGRGRLGRTFCSPDGGLYMSILLRMSLPLAHISRITLAAAVSVCQAVEHLCGLSLGIKWVNDIFCGSKKLCGILTEASIEGETGAVDSIVLGIGVNLHLDASLPEEIRKIACALDEFCSAPPRRAVLASEILNHLEQNLNLLNADQFVSILSEYRSRLFVLGKTVQVLGDGAPYSAIVDDINFDGHLLVHLPDGSRKTLFSGEISILPQK